VASSTNSIGSAASTLFSVNNTGSTTLFQIPSSLLKTDANGAIVAAIGDTDYVSGNTTLFSTTSAIHFADSSTTIPKTYTANTFLGTQTFNSASTTAISATNAFFTGNVGIGASNPLLQLDLVGSYTSNTTGSASGVLPYNSTPEIGMRANSTAAGTEATLNFTNTTAASNAFSSGTGQIGVIRTNVPNSGNSATSARSTSPTLVSPASARRCA
jgi:hypothetical protein